MHRIRTYRPPAALIVRKDTVLSIKGCSGFLIENLSTSQISCGPVDEEIIPIEQDGSRAFEAPDGGVYTGDYSIKFDGGAGQALVIRNYPHMVEQNIDAAKERVQAMQPDNVQYKENLI